jgi:hypothetical protein
MRYGTLKKDVKMSKSELTEEEMDALEEYVIFTTMMDDEEEWEQKDVESK